MALLYLVTVRLTYPVVDAHMALLYLVDGEVEEHSEETDGDSGHRDDRRHGERAAGGKNRESTDTDRITRIDRTCL